MHCPGTFNYAPSDPQEWIADCSKAYWQRSLAIRRGQATPVLDTDMGSTAKQCIAKGPGMPLFDFGGILTWTQHLWNFYVRRPPATGEDADTDVVVDMDIVFLLRPQHRH